MFRRYLIAVFAVLLLFAPKSSFAATLIGAGSVIEGRWSNMSPVGADGKSYGEYIRFAVPDGTTLTSDDVEIFVNGVKQNVSLEEVNGRYAYRNDYLRGDDYVRIVLKKPVVDVYFGFHGRSREYTYDDLVRQSRFFFRAPAKPAEHAKVVPVVMLKVLRDGGLLSVALTGLGSLLAVGLVPRLTSWFRRLLS